MKHFVAAVLAPIAALSLLSACGDDPVVTVRPDGTATDVTIPEGAGTLPSGITIPTDLTIPADLSIPSDFSVPQETIDLMIEQFEAAGMNVDRECFADLLTDDTLRQLAEAGGSGTPTPELMQKFFACLSG